MTLEAAINENTAVLKDLLSATKDLLSLRTEALEKVGGAISAAGKGAGKGKEKEESKANISTSPEDRKNPEEVGGATGANPYEGIKELIASYVTGTDRPEEREARKGKVKALLNHEKIKKAGVADPKSADDIMEAAVPLFKDQMEKLKAKGDLTQPAKAESDDLI